MKVIIEANLFQSSQQNQLELLTIFRLGYQNRHLISIEPSDSVGGVVETWLQHQNWWLCQECQIATDIGLAQVLAPASFIVRVSNIGAPDWSHWQTGKIAVLPLTEAVHFLSRPLKILVENNISDRNFLLTVALGEQRTLLHNFWQTGGIEFENGCGLGHIQNLLKDVKRDKYASYRTYVIFDSDALKPGKPSRDSDRLKKLCDDLSIPFHQLKRRAIENYLPLPTLKSWMLEHPHKELKGTSRKQLFNALTQLTLDQRAYFNMKRGFKGDSGPEQSKIIGNFYQNLPPRITKSLAHGFGESIAELFDPDRITENSLRTDGSLSEIENLLAEILALV